MFSDEEDDSYLQSRFDYSNYDLSDNSENDEHEDDHYICEVLQEETKKRGRPSRCDEDINHCKRRKLHPLVAIDNLQHVMCCDKFCFASSELQNKGEDIAKAREYFQAIKKEDRKQWVIDYLQMHVKSSTSPSSDHQSSILYTIGTKEVCKTAWCLALGLPQSTFYQIREMFLRGVNHIQQKVSREGYQTNETLTAMSWLKHFADRFGEKLPNDNKILLPMCVTKQYIYSRMEEELHDSGETKIISESHFYAKWRDTLPYVSILKLSRFTMCTKCLDFKTRISETMDKEQRQAIRKKMDKHINKQHVERKKYYKHIMKAKLHPETYMSIIMDGMDTNKTMLPHFVFKDKATATMWMLKTHLTGVIIHGIGHYGYFDYYQFAHGMEKKVFHKIKLSFLMVGHTHEDIDRSFSMFSRWLRKNNALTPRELIDGYEKSVDGTGIQLTEVHDVSQWLDGSMENLQNHSKPHTFRIKANPEGKAVIHWKKWTSDLTWNTCASERDDAFLLRDIPQNQPKVMSPNCAKLNLDIFEKDINKCVKMQKNPRVLPEWQRFIADLKTSEKDQNENNYEESSLWMLDEIIKATSTRARQNSTLLTSEDSSDEDAPIPHVIIGKGPRKPDRLQKPKKNS